MKIHVLVVAIIAAAFANSSDAHARRHFAVRQGFDGRSFDRRSAHIHGPKSFREQNTNLRSSAARPARASVTKVKTAFLTLDGQLVIAPALGMRVEAPVWGPKFHAASDFGADALNQPTLGDLRLEAIWTGSSKDKSSGLALGLKLPTGDRTHAKSLSDISTGTGTMDLLLGGYRIGALDETRRWKWFALELTDVPLDDHAGYRPGAEADGVVGVAWNAVGRDADAFAVTPILRLVGIVRQRDSGPKADRADSGYERLLLVPGVKVQTGRWTFSGDVGVAVQQKVNGSQLAAPVLIKVALSRPL